jgi:hypothetical protein
VGSPYRSLPYMGAARAEPDAFPMQTTTHTTRGWRHSSRLHYGIAAFAALAFATASTTVAHASDGQKSPLEAKLPPTPLVKKYTIKALGFTAVDESGWDGDWYAPISDEPYFIFSSVGKPGTSATMKSKTYSNVDSGDTRTFNPRIPVFPQTGGSAPAPSGIGLSVQLFDADGYGNSSANVATTSKYFKVAGAISPYVGAPDWVKSTLTYMGTAADIISSWLKDDLIGTTTFTYDRSTLDSRLPAAGSSFEDEQWIGMPDDADYHLRFLVTRTA